MSFFDTLLDNGFALGVFVLGISVLAGVIASHRDTYTADTIEYNLTNDGLGHIETLSDSSGTIVTIVVAVILIGAVMIIRKMRN
jgi:hypothetical protein